MIKALVLSLPSASFAQLWAVSIGLTLRYTHINLYTPVPTVIAQNVRAQPFNSTACLVHWEPVEDSRDHIKGKLGGYRVRSNTVLHGGATSSAFHFS